MIQNKGVSKTAVKERIQKTDKSFESLFSSTLVLRNTEEQSRLIRDLKDLFESLELREDSTKFDFDSDEGFALCKSILKLMEKLFNLYGLTKSNRDYRSKFSKAYKNLYEENGG